MKIKVKKLHPDAVIPSYAKPGDSGFDLVVCEDTSILPGETKIVPTGLAFELPEGKELQIRPRSGLSSKTKLRVCLGTVDNQFRGEVKIIVDHIGYPQLGDSVHEFMRKEVFIPKGTKLAQGVVVGVQQYELEESNELSETERSGSGFGSTGV